MENSQISRLPSNSIYYMLICAVLVLAFLLIGIYPSKKSLDNQSEEAARLNDQIEDQKILQPLYKGLLERVRSFDSADSKLPDKGRLAIDQVDQISSIIGGIANKCGFSLVEATPDVKTMSKDSKSLAVRVVMKGEFKSFRKVLLEFAGLSYVEHIEELQIQEGPEGKEFILKLWLSLYEAKGNVKT